MTEMISILRDMSMSRSVEVQHVTRHQVKMSDFSISAYEVLVDLIFFEQTSENYEVRFSNPGSLFNQNSIKNSKPILVFEEP